MSFSAAALAARRNGMTPALFSGERLRVLVASVRSADYTGLDFGHERRAVTALSIEGKRDSKMRAGTQLTLSGHPTLRCKVPDRLSKNTLQPLLC